MCGQPEKKIGQQGARSAACKALQNSSAIKCSFAHTQLCSRYSAAALHAVCTSQSMLCCNTVVYRSTTCSYFTCRACLQYSIAAQHALTSAYSMLCCTEAGSVSMLCTGVERIAFTQLVHHMHMHTDCCWNITCSCTAHVCAEHTTIWGCALFNHEYQRKLAQGVLLQTLLPRVRDHPVLKTI
jgi:hypothetical protein